MEKQKVTVLNAIGYYNTVVSVCVSKYSKGTVKIWYKKLKNGTHLYGHLP